MDFSLEEELFSLVPETFDSQFKTLDGEFLADEIPEDLLPPVVLEEPNFETDITFIKQIEKRTNLSSLSILQQIIDTNEDENDDTQNYGETKLFSDFVSLTETKRTIEILFGEYMYEFELIVHHAYPGYSDSYFTKAFRAEVLLSFFTPSDYSFLVDNRPIYHNFIINAKKILPSELTSALYTLCGERMNQISSLSNNLPVGRKGRAKTEMKIEIEPPAEKEKKKKIDRVLSQWIGDDYRVINTVSNSNNSCCNSLSTTHKVISKPAKFSLRKDEKEKKKTQEEPIRFTLFVEEDPIEYIPWSRISCCADDQQSSDDSNNNSNNNSSSEELSTGSKIAMKLCKYNQNYVYEYGVPHHLISEPFVHSFNIDQSQNDLLFYQDLFLNNKHNVYKAKEDDEISVICITRSEKNAPTFIAVFFLEKTVQLVTKVPQGTKISRILSAVISHLKLSKYTFKKLRLTDGIRTILTNIEQITYNPNFKVGVIYCAAGQVEEDDMLSNRDASEDFNEFLQFLGNEIILKDFQYFRGGMDTKKNATGEKSIYTKFLNYEIMFHISTFLPFSKSEKQQIERKRHIGNDIVVVIFKEGDQLFDPSSITSEFNHVFIVVQKVDQSQFIDGTLTYRIEVCCKSGTLNPFRPFLPSPSLVKADSKFHQFLMYKFINAERMVLKSESIQSRFLRSRRLMLETIPDK